MPYISSERVKQMRETIKKEFPAFKFSIIRDHSSEVRITILEGPLNFGMEQKCWDVNVYYIDEHYSGQAAEVLNRIYEIANTGNGVLVEDGDYGKVPNFYVSLRIGEWDKPYKWLISGSNGKPVAMVRVKELKKAS